MMIMSLINYCLLIIATATASTVSPASASYAAPHRAATPHQHHVSATKPVASSARQYAPMSYDTNYVAAINRRHTHHQSKRSSGNDYYVDNLTNSQLGNNKPTIYRDKRQWSSTARGLKIGDKLSHHQADAAAADQLATVKPECKAAMESMRETITEWDKLIESVRLNLSKGQLKVVAPVVRNMLDRNLNTMQNYANGARQALSKSNLREVNRNCRMAGLQLARLSINREVSKAEPQLEICAKKAREVYKKYRKACGGPAF